MDVSLKFRKISAGSKNNMEFAVDGILLLLTAR